MRFSIKTAIYDENNAETIIGDDEFNMLYDMEDFKSITFMQYFKEMYDKYNNKCIHFGTDLQEEILKEAYANNEIININNIKECISYLKEIDMDTVNIDGKTYKYGFGFIDNEPIEEGAIDKIAWLMTQPERILKKEEWYENI